MFTILPIFKSLVWLHSPYFQCLPNSTLESLVFVSFPFFFFEPV